MSSLGVEPNLLMLPRFGSYDNYIPSSQLTLTTMKLFTRGLPVALCTILLQSYEVNLSTGRRPFYVKYPFT